jgi:hypothetical protein
MRDMMATHERLDAATPTETREKVHKAVAAAFEALPAVLLAAALLMPALAAFAAKDAESKTRPQPDVVELSQAIAAQGNQALADIRAEARESARETLTLPKL